jgi:hypothetical protein
MTLRHFPSRRSCGAVLLVVLVCLALATGMFVLVVKQVGAERKELELNQWSLQAAWLAEAGVERAAAKLAADPKYLGETWTISAAELAGDEGGVVRIRVETVVGKPERRTVHIEADYPDAPERRCRQVKQVTVDRNAIQSPQPPKNA